MSTETSTWDGIGAIFVVAVMLSAGTWYLFVDDNDEPNGNVTKVSGCMDTNATNFDSTAELDDGSCVFPTPPVSGCMDLNATNHNPLAEIDDGTCVYSPPPPIVGCTDVNATNFDSTAEVDDGTCVYPPPPPIEGCTDANATNYDPLAELDDGSCEHTPPPVPGCTDPAASNYDGNANVDDGSCEYPPDPVPGCADPEATNYNPAATVDDGSCTYPPPPVDLEALTIQNAVGQQNVLVIAAHYPGENLTDTIPEIQEAVESVGRWFSNVSYGKVWFNVTVAGPYELSDIGTGSYEVYGAVIDDGYNLSDYNRIIVGGHSHQIASSFSTLGIDSRNITDNQGNIVEIIASRLQINSAFHFQGRVYEVIHHEMGHSFGLGHAGFHSSRTGQMFTYGTYNSIMGLPANLPFFSMPEAYQLGWIGEDNLTTVTSDGQWTLNTIENIDASGIRIPIPNDPSGERYYWITPRSQGVFSTAELTENFPPGALLPASGGGLSSLAIDTTPETHLWKAEMDSDLLPGRSWTDPTGTIHITLLESTNDTVTVSVRFSQNVTNSPPVINAVTATLVSTNPYVYDFSANATDADGDELTYFWNFKVNQGDKFGLANHGDGQNQSYAYDQQNPRRVWVTVSDGIGGVTKGWVDLENHSNQAPTLSGFTLSKSNSFVIFVSNASDADACVYTWDYGDGNFSNSKEGYHDYAVAGMYNVTLMVDDGEFKVTYTEEVDSDWPGYPPNVLPIADAGGNQTGVVGEDFVLNASGSYDPDSAPLSLRYVWICSNCTEPFEGRSMTVTVQGLEVGTWEFTLEVYDGRDYAYDTIWITVI